MKKGKYEDVFYIDINGVALDTYGNEQLSENGALIIIPMRLRKYFNIIERA